MLGPCDSLPQRGVCCLHRAVKKARGGKLTKEWLSDAQQQENFRENIREVLVELFDKHMEVPFVAMYRKQVCKCACWGRMQGDHERGCQHTACKVHCITADTS
jgi:hypothetical protein